MALDHSHDKNDSLLNVGAANARDIDALCADVAAIIFPTASDPPTEALISAVSAKLIELITDIEAALVGVKRSPVTWNILANSGFLREADLIDCILARASEDRLEGSVGSGEALLPYQLLDHADGNVADAAQTLLAAKSLFGQRSGGSHWDLPAELLHKLVWRVVAALEVVHGSRQSEAVENARLIITGYSEANRAQAASRKIVHLLDISERAKLLDPAQAGVTLHVAAIAADLELDYDHVVRLIDASSSSPYAVLLAALSIPKKDAIEAVFMFRGATMSTREAGIFNSGYAKLDPLQARIEIQKWASKRSHFLAFGQP